jgi:hypothetical protein
MDDGDRVIIIDEVHLAADMADSWLDRWRSDYLPGALDRELRLRGVWSGWTENPQEKTVVVCWSVSRVGRYWAARWTATEDDDVLEFWRWTDSLARHRTRRVLENSESSR